MTHLILELNSGQVKCNVTFEPGLKKGEPLKARIPQKKEAEVTVRTIYFKTDPIFVLFNLLKNVNFIDLLKPIIPPLVT